MALLEIENLQTHFRTPGGVNRAVDGVSFHVAEGETLGRHRRQFRFRFFSSGALTLLQKASCPVLTGRAAISPAWA
jgi:ABC-type antimicrobial peptide transport system ATPase subunit